MFSNLGGIWLLIPFVAAISIFSYLEIHREKEIKRWANKIAKEQHKDFYYSCFTIFGVTFVSAALIMVKIHLKMEMKARASLKFFTEMLDRVMTAPINLYFDVTPVGQIQSKFTKDLGAVEGEFYNLL